ncbi:hypothetical protein OG730_41820 (plasmid) [Streptomyces sp. NBC_01298]|uniref:hypothetical protein n=1 Tax=Streptomyces sp. NBC_01298 TaxID=2903817 RepID=UPI002E11BD63|nr:hypothetical protein OG730_41820 [Streptomyces sp. NBC_01298]
MEQSDGLPTGFSPDEYDRVAKAARVVGKSPEAFVRDAALDAADDPFLDALTRARKSVARLAPAFAEHSEEPRPEVTPGLSFPDPAPLGSRDLGQAHQSHAA